MKNTHREILDMIADYLQKNPDIRFGQALHNLGVNEFINKENPEDGMYLLRDIYNDSDGMVLKRMKNE